MRVLEVLFYENGRGGVAISIDGGEHVIIANGRKLRLTETTWEEGPEAWEALSAVQKSAIEEAKAALTLRTPAQSELDEVIYSFTKRRLHEARRNPAREPEKPKRELPDSVMIEYADIIND